MNKKTQSMAFANLIGSILFIAVGVWAYIQMAQLPVVKDTYAQPSAFPRIMVVGLLIFSVILLVQSVYKLVTMKEGDDDPLAQKAESLNFIKDKGVRGALIVIALCVLFVALFKPLGYVLDAAVVAILIMLLIGKRNWVQIILVALLIPLAMWFIFYKVLSVNIPMGPLQFLRDLLDKL